MLHQEAALLFGGELEVPELFVGANPIQRLNENEKADADDPVGVGRRGFNALRAAECRLKILAS